MKITRRAQAIAAAAGLAIIGLVGLQLTSDTVSDESFIQRQLATTNANLRTAVCLKKVQHRLRGPMMVMVVVSLTTAMHLYLDRINTI